MKAEELENRNKRKAERDLRIQENLDTKKAAKDEAVKKKEEDTKRKSCYFKIVFFYKITFL